MLFCEMIHSSLKMTSNNFFVPLVLEKEYIFTMLKHTYKIQITHWLYVVGFFSKRVWFIPFQLNYRTLNFFFGMIYLHHMVLRRVQMLLTKSSINQNYVEARMYVPLTEIFFSTPFLCTYFIKKKLYICTT